MIGGTSASENGRAIAVSLVKARGIRLPSAVTNEWLLRKLAEFGKVEVLPEYSKTKVRAAMQRLARETDLPTPPPKPKPTISGALKYETYCLDMYAGIAVKCLGCRKTKDAVANCSDATCGLYPVRPFRPECPFD